MGVALTKNNVLRQEIQPSNAAENLTFITIVEMSENVGLSFDTTLKIKDVEQSRIHAGVDHPVV